MTQPFTASEMRDAAQRLIGIAEHLRETLNDARRAYEVRKAAQMLRQAADAMEGKRETMLATAYEAIDAFMAMDPTFSTTCDAHLEVIADKDTSMGRLAMAVIKGRSVIRQRSALQADLAAMQDKGEG